MSFTGIQGPPSTSEKWLYLISLVLEEKTVVALPDMSGCQQKKTP